MDKKDTDVIRSIWLDNWEESWDMFMKDEEAKGIVGTRMLTDSCERINKERSKGTNVH